METDDILILDLINTLKKFGKYIYKKALVIIISGVIGGFVGLGIGILRKPVYTAKCSFVLEEEKSGGLGKYAGLASIVGLDLSLGGGGVFEGDNILALYKSRRMLKATLLSKGNFFGKSQVLIERYIAFNNLQNKLLTNANLKYISFDTEPKQFSTTHDSIISIIVRDINKSSLSVRRPDKKSSIIEVEFKSKDEMFAKFFVDNLVKNVNQFYVETKTKKSGENLFILKHQVDSVRRELNKALLGAATSTDAIPNLNPVRSVLRVSSQKKAVDIKANQAILEELVKNLEIAKISFRKEAPLIQVIDNPIFPLENDKFSKAIAVAVGMLLGIILILFYLVVQFVFIGLKNKMYVETFEP